MNPRRTLERGALALLLSLLPPLALPGAGVAQAREAETEESAPVPCAVVEAVTGDADLLDPSRTHLLEMKQRAAVPCGGWVSIKTGAVSLKHRDGYRIHLGKGAFAQLTESNEDGRQSGDHLILFRGEAYAQAPGGTGELRVVTSNSRSRVRKGAAIVVYQQAEDETQLVALQGDSSLENRFEPSRKVTLRAGEATSLNFKLLRVVPSQARAVAASSLRPRIAKLLVPGPAGAEALRHARERQERVFAAPLADQAEAAEQVRLSPARRQPASAEPRPGAAPSAPGSDLKRYERHESGAEDESLRKHLESRVVAGAPEAEKLLHPRTKAQAAHARRARVTIVSPAAARKPASSPTEEEKRRLIEELSRIRED